jgi:glycerophosphoryl diester phosphodiesterase
MQNHPYFITDKVIVLAHRGGTDPTENTVQAIALKTALKEKALAPNLKKGCV